MLAKLRSSFENVMQFQTKIVSLLVCILSTQFGNCQIEGIITDIKTGHPIPYVNVWIKNNSSGSTTNAAGEFLIINGKAGDTLLISNLGYKKQEQIASSTNIIKLIPKAIELNEILVLPTHSQNFSMITSYNRPSQVKEFYYNGHYSLARYFPYKNEYSSNRFISKIYLITLSALKTKVKFRVHLLSADKNGHPSSNLLSDYFLLECGKGKSQIEVDLQNENILIPENGFFVVVDRLNLEQNKFSNKLAKDMLQPAIGMVKDKEPMNTWMTFGGRWLPPEKMKEIPTWKNIAVNILLSD
ncbi:MAG: carboxypeptidase-like regulatory domain-containing protein [Eudoraea sp.]|nr:carboxypeptidase-like regulatory domain-containing protein [Eudoraea sp.]